MNHNRHVKALYDVSFAHHQVLDMLQTLKQVHDALTPKVILYLDAPTVLFKDKVLFFDAFAQPKETHAFLLILLKKKMMHAFSQFFHHMTTYIQQINHEVIVDVFVAKPLLETQKVQLMSELKTFLKASQVIINTHTDSNVIGGMRLQYQGKALDFSVVSRLDQMKTTI